MEKSEMKRFDWHLIWGALAVMIPVLVTVMSCFISLKSDIAELRSDLKVIKAVLILRGIVPNELASDARNPNLVR